MAGASGTNTIYYRSAADTWSAVTIGTNLTFTGGTLSASGGGGGGDVFTSSANAFTVGGHTIATAAGVIGLSIDGASTPTVSVFRVQRGSNVQFNVMSDGTIGILPVRTGLTASDIRFEFYQTRNSPHGSTLQIVDPTEGVTRRAITTSSGRVGLGEGALSASLTDSRIEFRGSQMFIDAITSGGVIFAENDSSNNNQLVLVHNSQSGAGDRFYLRTARVSDAASRPYLQLSANEVEFRLGVDGNDDTTNTNVTAFAFRNETSGVTSYSMQNLSSTNALREQSRIKSEWATSTDASRAGRLTLSTYSVTTSQEGVRLESASGGLNISLFGAGSWGGGDNVIFLKDCATAPSTNPTGGGILYSEGGAQKCGGR